MRFCVCVRNFHTIIIYPIRAIPFHTFFFYDLSERKAKNHMFAFLKVRAVFEDYGNNAMKDKDIVEMIDLVNNAKEMAVATPKKLDKSSYKGISDKKCSVKKQKKLIEQM